MVINFDQTGLNIVPASEWTMDVRGSKQIEITGLEDKRQITAVLACSLTGTLLPLQLIYRGKTPKCHPNFSFPSDWNVTHSENHWSNVSNMEEYIQTIIVPYFDAVRKKEGLPSTQPGLVIMDVFRAHTVDTILSELGKHHIRVVYVPANCTGELQPLDLSGNGEFKAELKNHFINWYAAKITEAGDEEPDISLKLSVVKPLHARWVLAAWEALRDNKDTLLTGWIQSGIKQAFESVTATNEEPQEEIRIDIP